MALPEDELILDDGEHELRARCGNMISDDPRTPTLETEPAPPSFDEIEPTLPGVTRRPVPIAHAPLLPVPSAPESSPQTPGNPQRRVSVPPVLIWFPRTSTSTSGTVDSPDAEGPSISDQVPDNPATDGDNPGPDPGVPDHGGPGPGDPGSPSFPDPIFPPSDPWRPPTPDDPPPPVSVPEPGTLLLIGIGGGMAALFRARR